jgi:hypothetical protein
MAQSNAFKFANNILTNGGYDAADLVGAAGGKVLQVVSTTKIDTFTLSSTTTFTDITGLSVSITPSSASNKILVMFSITTSNTSASFGTHIRLMRDSTEIAPARSVANYESSWHLYHDGDTNLSVQKSFEFLDSPSTTSATTYKVQTLATSGVAYVNRRAFNDSFGTSSSITVMEIKG